MSFYLHTKVYLKIISGGDLCPVGTSKLICEANRWAGSCVMHFLPEGCPEQTMMLHLCGSGEYTTVLCFTIRGRDARVPISHLECGGFPGTVSAVLSRHRVRVYFSLWYK